MDMRETITSLKRCAELLRVKINIHISCIKSGRRDQSDYDLQQRDLEEQVQSLKDKLEARPEVDSPASLDISQQVQRMEFSLERAGEMLAWGCRRSWA